MEAAIKIIFWRVGRFLHIFSFLFLFFFWGGAGGGYSRTQHRLFSKKNQEYQA